MPRITDEQMSRAFEVLSDESHAKARAAHDYMTEMTKTVLAKLMGQSDAKSAVEREQFARAHDDYAEHLRQKRDVAELDYYGRQRIAAAEAVIEVWRSQQANNRTLQSVR